ncbi:hypothetical protein [Sporosarcina limicola]|uniref:Uncharacterized protein n=1 Tax=Sporosarcina limicola TaxID=34101 RepID=A0A927RE47_9BACL|nr:hypothetical protein [Sporosarcina limicola]MBE1554252.1 hypothetical protein [Sporosarcina limicola]
MNESDKTIISSITYISVERIAHWYEQKVYRSIHQIQLFSDVISTTKQTFQLEHIHDISYRPFSGGTGLFYLHTNQGVLTFEIDVNPAEFIKAYKELR